ncbi:MAG: T9SS type A sorting domain-containing protein [Bacteroidota bacterium]
MSLFQKISVILMVAFYPVANMHAQINVYNQNCNTITPQQYDNGSAFNAGCYELPENSGQVYQTSTQKEIVAEDHILLEDEVEFTASGDGQADLRIEAIPFDVVAFTNSLDNVKKLDKFELGLTLPDFYDQAVKNFINESGTPQINPFLSDQIEIVAEFSHVKYDTNIIDMYPDPPEEVVTTTEIVKKRHGYFTTDISRDISGFDDLYNDPLLNDTNVYVGQDYDSLGGGWTDSYSDYPFRVRFAPPHTGKWTCKIMVNILDGTTVYESPTFSFNVIDSNIPNYLRVGKNGRWLKREGKTYVPNGPNYPFVLRSGYPLKAKDGVNYSLMRDAIYYDKTAPIAAYEQYLRYMDTLAQNGVNYFRMMMNPWAQGIEYEKLGDYSDRMHIAKEMDLIVERARTNGMMIHWNLMTHFMFQDEPYGIKFWDWTQHNSDGSDLYCYRSDPQLQLNEEIDWFTNPKSKKYYKERLRYIVARWGYSPDIAAFEHFSEVDQIGGDGDGDNDTIDYITESYQDEIATWHAEMSAYLKDDLYVDQLISPSYTRDIDDPFSDSTVGTDNDYSFSLENIDMVNYNAYDYGYKGTDNRKYPKRFHFFSFPSGPLYDVMNLGANNYTTGRGEYKKPVFYSEAGTAKTWGCDSPEIEIKRDIYKAMFSGLAGFLHWEIQRKDFYFDFRPLDVFFENVDLEYEKYHSGFTQLDNDEWKAKQSYIDDAISNDLDVDLTYLRSEDKSSAIGVITNRTYNYQTMGGCNSQNGDDPLYYYAATDDDYVKQGGVHILLDEDMGSRVKLRNMQFGKYDITYYKYNLENEVISTSSDFGPIVKVEFPQLDLNNWMILFKAEKRNSKSKSNNSSIKSEENRSEETRPVFLVYPNPTSESFSYTSNSELFRIELYSVQGRSILSKDNLSREGNIDVSNLVKGIYMIKAYLKNGDIVTTKLIIE